MHLSRRRQQSLLPLLQPGAPGGKHPGGRGPPLIGGGGNGSSGWHWGSADEGPGDWSLQASGSLHWQGWEDRVRADSSFKDKVLIEQVRMKKSSTTHWGDQFVASHRLPTLAA